LQTSPSFISLVILKSKTDKIPIAKIENSNPLKGKNVKAAVPKPKTDSKPIPQAAHPGAIIPRKIPVVPKTPNDFVEVDLIIDVLYKINANKIPIRKDIINTLMKLLKDIFSLNPIKNAQNRFNALINPDCL